MHYDRPFLSSSHFAVIYLVYPPLELVTLRLDRDLYMPMSPHPLDPLTPQEVRSDC